LSSLIVQSEKLKRKIKDLVYGFECDKLDCDDCAIVDICDLLEHPKTENISYEPLLVEEPIKCPHCQSENITNPVKQHFPSINKTLYICQCHDCLKIFNSDGTKINLKREKKP
jgi:hypothetical protein